MNKNLLTSLMLMTLLSFFSCGPTRDLITVAEVDLNQYQGKWYEIARLPNSFERGLNSITAEYRLMENGRIEVINSGRKIDDPSKLQQSKGIAKVPDERYPGRLKVSFFRPFWGDYYIFELDGAYRYALVGTPSRDYFWILARTPELDEETLKRLLQRASDEGFDTSKLIFPEP
mgnify:CR=1 FL=1